MQHSQREFRGVKARNGSNEYNVIIVRHNITSSGVQVRQRERKREGKEINKEPPALR